MGEQSPETTQQGYRVTERIDGAQAGLPTYPLLPGDLLVREPDGTWMKEAPGLAVGGFRLTAAQEASLQLVRFASAGLAYAVITEGSGT